MYEQVKTGCKHIPLSEHPLQFQFGYCLIKPRTLHKLHLIAFLSVGRKKFSRFTISASAALWYWSLKKQIFRLLYIAVVLNSVICLLHRRCVVMYQCRYRRSCLRTGWLNTSFSPLRIARIYTRNLITDVLKVTASWNCILYGTNQKIQSIYCAHKLYV